MNTKYIRCYQLYDKCDHRNSKKWNFFYKKKKCIYFLKWCQDVLTNLTETWRKALDNRDSVAGLSINLCKAFDCVPHGLLIAKLNAYGFNKDACNFIKSYLSNRQQWVKLRGNISDWVRIIKRGSTRCNTRTPPLQYIYQLFILILNS